MTNIILVSILSVWDFVKGFHKWWCVVPDWLMPLGIGLSLVYEGILFFSQFFCNKVSSLSRRTMWIFGLHKLLLCWFECPFIHYLSKPSLGWFLTLTLSMTYQVLITILYTASSVKGCIVNITHQITFYCPYIALFLMWLLGTLLYIIHNFQNHHLRRATRSRKKSNPCPI